MGSSSEPSGNFRNGIASRGNLFDGLLLEFFGKSLTRHKHLILELDYEAFKSLVKSGRSSPRGLVPFQHCGEIDI